MFSHYFVGDGIVNEVAPTPTDPYPQWQSSNVLLYGGLFGVLPSIPWGKVKLAWKVLRLIFSNDFDRAVKIVKEVSITPGMNDGKAWGEIGQYMGKTKVVGENVYRHLLACQKWGPEICGNRQERDTLLQLAYVAHKGKMIKNG